MESILRTERYQQTAERLDATIELFLNKTLYPWQRDAALALHFGVDVVCTVATGEGKSLAFLSPMLVAGG
jgi:ATP-dependent helicase YprA (DUF1998 family)